MIKAKVNIETARKRYAPGEIINEQLSDEDMSFLRSHGFISEESGAADTAGDKAVNGKEAKRQADSSGIQDPGERSGVEDVRFKDEADLKKLNKDEIVEYAGAIGLVLDSNMLKNDMIDSVLNRIGEILEE